ncbi:MAG TPA: DUF4350 domain-containing protein [Kofleriaceae bacterium]|jgi:hypothetical protein
MRTASPWWASLIFGFGLLLVLVGERIFGTSGAREVLTWIGVILVLAVTALRVWTTLATHGMRRKVERTLLLSHIGVLVALFLYVLTTKTGIGWMSLDAKGAAKAETVLTVLYAIILFASLVPMFMIEMSLGVALRDHIDLGSSNDEGLEYMRVREIGWSGLAVALAAAFLMVTCNVASERNVQRDVSYFKTASPGESSIGIVASSSEPIKVMLWFPDPNEVGDQVKDYFDALAAATGKVIVEEHDRYVEEKLANKYKVTKDGMIVLVRGNDKDEKTESLEIDTDLEKARRATGNNAKLRNLDREVNKLLRQIITDKRKAYLTTGHGELTDPESLPPELKGRIPEQRTTVFRKRLGELGYDVKDLPPIDLMKDVPADAAVVICIGPTGGLQPAEWSALDRYLEKGGRLLLAMDPHGEATFGALEGRLGVQFDAAPLTDDQNFLTQRGTIADRRSPASTQFSAHASTTSLSRSSRGLVLIGAGALEDAPFRVKGEAPKRTYTINSMDTSWLDTTPNFQFDAGTEKRQKWHIAAAIEGPKLGKEKVKGKDGKETEKDKEGFRALVFADAALFGDAYVQDSGMVRPKMISELFGGQLAGDSVDWLAGKEIFTGDVQSQEDKAIQHTKGQDAVWFTLTMVGAPLLVLALGLGGTFLRRRRSAKKTVEVKP